MKHATSHFILNGKTVTPEVITERLSNSGSPEWEKELYLFLDEWFSDSDFVLAQTSGSTGEPKPIELHKSVMQKSAERTIEYFGLQKNNRLLLSLPCRYIAGKMMVVRAIVGQMNLIAVDPATDFDFLEHEKFDFGAMVPNQVFKLLEQPSGIEKLQNIRNLLVGGSAISTVLESQISQLSSRVVITYGMTETASHIAIRELSGNRRSDFYHCLPGISVNLGENDCLQIHHPEFTEPIQTNDLAELQSPVSFRILGRADSVIISGGIKYSPELLEKKLEPIISRRFVISSVPDEKLGEQLVLVIEGKPFDTHILKQKIALILTPYESPKSIRFIDRFPETNSGKIIRSNIKKMLRK
ncbi:o-succinylbenzoic acid--CoA ligase [Aquipluma nitroreducens]|uniref:O-succinylbenzoic acid--CoA ligase n=1 Tax=Aquipluma nitroreducens TaxID=2010828 RepID=A0A5K7S831_9BACT|nr:AMP-binding protein [Aquipluma nitroreducens]BBE17645.1 o-succinylbenzoic acid--CoA ligase [Aquipluma nitroreducens]